MLSATFKKNDKQAKILIGIFSFVVFAVVVTLGKIKLDVQTSFNIHIFATANAIINALIAVLLIAALVTVKQKKYSIHKQIMLAALWLSIAFLVSYIAHHLLAGEAKFGDSNFDGIVDETEKSVVGSFRIIYLVILATHILLATVILPFILYTAYKGLTAEFADHKKLSKIIWPLWFYVAATGPIVYLMIKPYYH